jgi:ClpP class serine protease
VPSSSPRRTSPSTSSCTHRVAWSWPPSRSRTPCSLIPPRLIALAADEILLSPSAVLGPVDPQLGRHPAASVLTVLERKDINEIDDETLIMADVSRKAINQIRETISRLLMRGGSDTAAAEKLAHLLSEGHWTHDYPITAEIAKDLGLPVATDPPDEVRQIIRLYPQPRGHRPAVEYIPVPYNPSRSSDHRD